MSLTSLMSENSSVLHCVVACGRFKPNSVISPSLTARGAYWPNGGVVCLVHEVAGFIGSLSQLCNPAAHGCRQSHPAGSGPFRRIRNSIKVIS